MVGSGLGLDKTIVPDRFLCLHELLFNIRQRWMSITSVLYQYTVSRYNCT